MRIKDRMLEKEDRWSVWMRDRKVIACTSMACIMLMCWMPYFLSFFPGIIRLDELTCLKQALGYLPLHNHHPVLFTGYLWIISKIVLEAGGTLNAVLGVAVFLQMIFQAFVLGRLVLFLSQRGCWLWLRIFSMTFFALSPVTAIFAVRLGKDTFFAGWIVLYTMLIYKICNEEYLQKARRRTVWAYFIILSLMVSFSRSNGMYVVCVVLVVLFVRCVAVRIHMGLACLIIWAVTIIIKGPIFNYYNIAGSPVAEAFSVPIQQMANALINGNVEASDLAFLDSIFPIEEWRENYTPSVTDSIKFHDDFNQALLNDNAPKFLHVWVKNLIPNFRWYVNAYLEQVRGYWDIREVTYITSYDIAKNDLGIAQTDMIERVSGHSVKDLCILAVQVMRKLPIVRMFTSHAFLILFYVIVFVCICFMGNIDYAISLIPIIALWLTLMIAAPVSTQFRYLYSYHLLVPFALWLLGRVNWAQRREICNN